MLTSLVTDLGMSMLLLVAARGSSQPVRAAGQEVSLVEDDAHFPQPLITGLESKLDAAWEFPNDLRLLGTQELVQLGESTHMSTKAAAQPQRAGAPLECECEKVKCSCVKRCDCHLPSGTSVCD